MAGHGNVQVINNTTTTTTTTTCDRTVKEWFRIVGYHGSLFTLEDLKLCLSDADVATKNRHGETVSDVLLRTKYNMDDISNGHYKYWMQ